MKVTARAPGKLVLWGEYAVLQGAPAVAIAVDCFASARFDSSTENHWQIDTPGLSSAVNKITIPGLIISSEPAPNSQEALLWHALNALKGHVNHLPKGGKLTLDSTAFHSGGRKMGLGSSAAVCTALTTLLLHLANEPADFTTAVSAHRSAQNGKGSGIDVAAAYYGGVVCLTPQIAEASNMPTARAYDWPLSLHWQAFWTGQPAQTTAHINRFADWLSGTHEPLPLQRLIARAKVLAGGFTLPDFQRYIQALQDFDTASGVGIYTPMHTKLHNLAEHHEVLYKPCGAGGGDTGIAISSSADALSAFTRAATEIASSTALHPLELRSAEHGIQISA